MASYGYVTPDGFTILGWFNRTTIPPGTNAEGEHLFVQYGQAPHNWSTLDQVNGRQLDMAYTSDSKLRLEVRNEKDGSLLLSWVSSDARPEVNDGNWHFFCCRLLSDKKTFDMWIDDELVTTAATDDDPGNPAVCSAVIDWWTPGILEFGGGIAFNDGNFGHDLWTGSLAYLAVIPAPLSDARIATYASIGQQGSVYAGDTEVKRLDRILDWAGIPEDARNYDAPLTTLEGFESGQGATDAVNSTAEAASGIVFADGQSRIVYQNRRRRYNRFNFATLAESLSSSVEVGMQFSTDDTQVYNDITATRPDGITLRIQDKASQGEYGRKTYEINASVTSDTELRNMASWVLNRYSHDRVRVQQCYLQAESSEIIQYIAETIQIGDVLVFDELTPNFPDTTLTYTVDAIAVSADFGAPSWQVQLTLTPNDLNYVFQVGVGTVGDGAYVAF